MKYVALSLSLMLLVGGVAEAQQVLYTNFGPGFTFDTLLYIVGPTGVPVYAAQFQPSVSGAFGDAKLALSATSASLVASVYLETDAGGHPGTILEGPINATNLPGVFTPGVVTFSSTAHPMLTAGTSYWLVLDPIAAINWIWNITGDFSTFTNFASSLSPTGPWVNIPFATRPAFQIDGLSTDTYQVRYFSNVTTLGGSLINLSNTGAIDPATAPGTICANIYVFDPNEEELECCSCQITPNALQSISVTALLSQNLTPEHPDSTVVKLLATGLVGTTCDPTTAGSATNPLVPGLRAWASTLHSSGGTSGFTYGTETEFSQAGATLTLGELNRLTNTCAFIKANGSGNGQCSVCSTAGGQ